MTKISNLYTLTNYISANSSGNVVIAAPSSGYALDVTGTGRFTDILTGTGATFSGGAINLTPTTFAIGSSSATDANSATFQSATNNYLLRFKNSGGTSLGGFYYDGTNFIADQANWKFGSRVGIGNMLTVNATSSINAPSSGKSIEMVYRTDGGNDYAFIQAYDRTNSVFKRLDLNSAVTIVSAGNVGIGLTNPTGQLSLANQISNGANPISSYAAVGGGFGQNFFNGYYASNTDNLGTYPRYLDIVSVGSPDGTNGGSNIRFFTNPIANNSPAVERMRITSAGNMGLGNGSAYAPYLLTLNVTGGGGTIGGIDNSNGASLGFIQFNAGSLFLNARGNGDTNDMVFYTGANERIRIKPAGDIQFKNTLVSYTGSTGSPTIDTSVSFTGLANGGTVDFPSMSGMILVNNLGTGAVQVFICGGGNTASLGYVVNSTGSMAHNPSIGGYRFTNNTGSTWSYSFQVFKTRGTA